MTAEKKEVTAMMISPMGYVENLKDLSYEDLIDEREQLIRSIRDFEEAEKAGDRSGDEWMIMPSPATRYRMNLEYLSELCAYMSEKYCREGEE